MRYIDVHTGFKGITEQQLRSAHAKDLQNEKAEGVHFIRAWADPDQGKVFCLSEAPNREAVLRVHQKSGQPPTEIYEVPITIE